MEDDDFTPSERKVLRRMLREYEAKLDREAQERAAALTKELSARYGPLHRSGG